MIPFKSDHKVSHRNDCALETNSEKVLNPCRLKKQSVGGTECTAQMLVSKLLQKCIAKIYAFKCIILLSNCKQRSLVIVRLMNSLELLYLS